MPGRTVIKITRLELYNPTQKWIVRLFKTKQHAARLTSFKVRQWGGKVHKPPWKPLNKWHPLNLSSWVFHVSVCTPLNGHHWSLRIHKAQKGKQFHGRLQRTILLILAYRKSWLKHLTCTSLGPLTIPIYFIVGLTKQKDHVVSYNKPNQKYH